MTRLQERNRAKKNKKATARLVKARKQAARLTIGPACFSCPNYPFHKKSWAVSENVYGIDCLCSCKWL